MPQKLILSSERKHKTKLKKGRKSASEVKIIRCAVDAINGISEV